MDKKSSLSLGYSMIEMMVVVAIMGVVATMGFWGLRNFDDGQVLINSQQELISRLRTAQNSTLAMVGGKKTQGVLLTNFVVSNGLYGYTIDGQSYYLPRGVTVDFIVSNWNPISYLTICFHNPNVNVSVSCKEYINGITNSSTCTDSYACTNSGSNVGSNTPIINLRYKGATKQIKIEGSGKFVSRIYEP